MVIQGIFVGAIALWWQNSLQGGFKVETAFPCGAHSPGCLGYFSGMNLGIINMINHYKYKDPIINQPGWLMKFVSLGFFRWTSSGWE